MSMVNTRSSLFVLATVLLGTALSLPEAASARTDGPFASFLGNWRGRGEVVDTAGKTEPITCRAHYEVSESGATLTQTLVCASDSYRFDVKSSVIADGTSVGGGWQETTRSVAGNLTGKVKDGEFEGKVDGPGFTADISLRSIGHEQMVIISPHAGAVSKVQVTMKHGD
jgi:hypothetical protein